MKQYLTVLLLLCFFFQSEAQIFVKQDATGSADGTSWENAYTDLQIALDAAQTFDAIWVATGTYTVPLDTTIRSNYGRFIVKTPVMIYGGFSGTETSLDERAADAKSTLSADINGDDIENDLTSNKADNATRVMYVDSLLTDATLFDGLIFEGGHGVNDREVAYEFSSGAGILARSTIAVNNCVFRNNYTLAGAAINLLGGGTEGSEIRDSDFHNNEAPAPDGQAGGILVNDTRNITISGCDFYDNIATRGALYTLYAVFVGVENCTFSNNVNSEGFGGALFSWNSAEVVYQNCDFINNVAANGGVIYNDGRQFDFLNITFQDCMFDSNQAIGWGGGALYNWRSQTKVVDCEFRNNSAANTGGAIYNSGEGTQTEITTTTFEGNQANGGWGGSAAFYSDSKGTITNCDFIGNEAATSGGALTAGFKGQMDIRNCYMENNVARFGGAIYAQNDTTAIRVDSTSFILNRTSSFGGAILISGGIDLDVQHSLFQENSSDFGGAIATFIDTIILPELNLSHNVFSFNSAETQGGALNLFNTNTKISDCLFSVNVASGANGGAISHNSFDGYYAELDVRSSTLASNIALEGAGIAVFAGDGDSTSVFIQNTILSENNGGNYVNESPDDLVYINSLGGNLSSDETMMEVLTHTADIHGMNPMFIDDFDNFRLLEGSPAIDAGVETETTSPYDLDGNPRVGQVDIGAYEFQTMSGLFEPKRDELSLKLAPNPVREKVVLSMSNELQGQIIVRILSLNGKELRNQTFLKYETDAQIELLTGDLPQGAYHVVVTDGIKLGSTTMMKL